MWDWAANGTTILRMIAKGSLAEAFLTIAAHELGVLLLTTGGHGKGYVL